MNAVAVTGVGVVSPVGCGVGALWEGLVAGRCGIGPLTLFDVSAMPVRIGGQAWCFDPAAALAAFPGASSTRDRKVWMGLDAALQAVSDARLPHAALADASLHIGVGLEMLCLEDLTPLAGSDNLGEAIARTLPARMNGRSLQTPLDTTAALLGRRFGFHGGRWTNCSACAAGAQAIGEALTALRSGDAEVALAGATDSMLNPMGLGGFSILRVLSDENDAPQTACRPFDVSRKGTALGEGAAFLVLETLPHARRRGADIYAMLSGYATTLDAYRVSDPDPAGQGALRCMRQAMADAELDPDEIDCVSAHGTGTPKNDVVETQAIRQALGRRARQIPVHAVKSMTGHMIAASGAVEAAAAALTIHRRTVPPTVSLHRPDPECDLDYVPLRARSFAGDTVLSNSFGFGGQNATLIFTREPQ